MDLAHIFSAVQGIGNAVLIIFGALHLIARYTPWDAQVETVLSKAEAPIKAVLAFFGGGNPPAPPAPSAQ